MLADSAEAPKRQGAAFKQEIRETFFRHPVITANPYTKWFKRGLADTEQMRELVLQFSVFSNHFIVAQAKRMVFAADAEAEEGARHILMNECGVGLNAQTGSAEGRTFSSRNAHLNWLRETGRALGLEPRRLGRWEEATDATRCFLDELDRSYGSPDACLGGGASFAVETWAAFGIGEGPEAEAENFWHELIAGLAGYNRARRLSQGLPPVPDAFFRYHFRMEAGHGANVWRELDRSLGSPGFEPAKFLEGGRRALNAVHLFWSGLAGLC